MLARQFLELDGSMDETDAMKQRIFRADRLTLLFPLALLFAGLFWCINFARSPLVTIAVVVLLTITFVFARERFVQIWRQKLILKGDRLIYFDGQTRHQFLVAEIALIRLNRWTGNFRTRQNEGHSLALLPQENGKIAHWDLSDFSLRVVLRVVCELSRRAQHPPIEIFQTEFKEMKAELQRATRGLGILAPQPLHRVDETTFSRWDKEIRRNERRYGFTPHR